MRERRLTHEADIDPLSYYLKEIATYPLLSAAEEREIGRQMADARAQLDVLDSELNGNCPDGGCRETEELNAEKEKIEARLKRCKNRLINANLRLVVSIAKRYQNRGLALLDLIDEGNIGLIEAVERFDFRRGCRFSTYGTWWIRQAVVKAVADKGRLVRIPLHMLNIIRKCFSAAKTVTQELGRDPQPEDLAQLLQLPAGRVADLMHMMGESASLDVAMDEEGSSSLANVLPDDSGQEPFDIAFHVTLQDMLSEVLSQLSDREMRIISLRFGLSGEGPFTLEETGRHLGITRERVRQIQEKAMNKLRNMELVRSFHE